jgi:hypothetical protein
LATLTRRPLFGLYVIATLAVLQAVVALLRSFELFRVGTDLTGRGVLLIPLMGLITVARGGLVAVVALLYVLFAWGALIGKTWGWWSGLLAAVINGVLVLSLALQGEAVMHSLVWGIVPAIVLLYLFAPAGRELLKH